MHHPARSAGLCGGRRSTTAGNTAAAGDKARGRDDKALGRTAAEIGRPGARLVPRRRGGAPGGERARLQIPGGRRARSALARGAPQARGRGRPGPGLSPGPRLPASRATRGRSERPVPAVRRLAGRPAAAPQDRATTGPPGIRPERRRRRAPDPRGGRAARPGPGDAGEPDGPGGAFRQGRRVAGVGSRAGVAAAAGSGAPGGPPGDRGDRTRAPAAPVQPGRRLGPSIVRRSFAPRDADLRSWTFRLRAGRRDRRHGAGLRPVLLPGHGQRAAALRRLRPGPVPGGGARPGPAQGHSVLQLVGDADRR